MKVDGMGVVQHVFRRVTDRIEESDPVYAPIVNAPLQKVMDNTVALYSIINTISGAEGMRALAEKEFSSLVDDLFLPGVFYKSGRVRPIPLFVRIDGGDLLTSGKVVELGQWPPPDGVWRIAEVDGLEIWYNDNSDIAVSKIKEGQAETKMDKETGVLSLRGQVFEGVLFNESPAIILKDGNLHVRFGIVEVDTWPPSDGIWYPLDVFDESDTTVSLSLLRDDRWRVGVTSFREGEPETKLDPQTGVLDLRGRVIEGGDPHGGGLLPLEFIPPRGGYGWDEENPVLVFGENSVMIEGKEILIPPGLRVPFPASGAKFDSGNLFIQGEVVEVQTWPPGPEWEQKTFVDASTNEPLTLFMNEDFDLAVTELTEDSISTHMDATSGALDLRGQVFEDVSTVIPNCIVFLEVWDQLIDAKSGVGLVGPANSIDDKVVYQEGCRNDGLERWPLKKIFPHVAQHHLDAAQPGDITTIQRQYRIRIVADVESLNEVASQGSLPAPSEDRFQESERGLFRSGMVVASLWFVIKQQPGVMDVSVEDKREVCRSSGGDVTLLASGGAVFGDLVFESGVTFGEQFRVVYNRDRDSLDFVPL